MMGVEDVYLLTSVEMNRHYNAYVTNGEKMFFWEVNMIQQKDRVQILLSKIPEDVAVTASVQFSRTEAREIDTVLKNCTDSVTETSSGILDKRI